MVGVNIGLPGAVCRSRVGAMLFCWHVSRLWSVGYCSVLDELW